MASRDRYETALRGNRKFSLVRALTAAAHGALDGLEREISDETEAKLKAFVDNYAKSFA